MAKVYDSILDLVGKTPLVELKRIEEKEGLQAKLIAKVESFNPAGSVKDRIAKAQPTKRQQVRRSGKIPTERLTSLLPVSAPAERSPERVSI